MKGQIDGQIPLITYANEQLNMDGQMQFNMFNGMVAMSGLRIDRPIGVAPKLYANLTMRNIDLGDLTRTFNFGSIEGKLEGDVKNLRLENWKPVYMDAIIQTADGKHVKKSHNAQWRILLHWVVKAPLPRCSVRFYDSLKSLTTKKLA